MSRRHAKGRNIQGIVLLDKPVGISSNHALQKVKRIYSARKAGHTGSLDPLASGLLPVCFGEATKVSAFLLNADKQYHAVCRLGEKTRSGDTEGEVIERLPVPELDQNKLKKILDQFKGEITQIPPMHSAIKYKGQPLYKLAHQGIEVERKPRTVTVYELNLIQYKKPDFTIEVRCSKGTYIRTLAEDIGQAVGCGAHVQSMQRTKVGPYHIEQSASLEKLECGQLSTAQLDELIKPIESALLEWPAVNLTKDSSYYLRLGQPVFVPHAPQPGWVRLYEKNDGFLGMGEVLEDGRVAPKRLVRVH